MSTARINQTLESTNPTSFAALVGDNKEITIGNIKIKRIISDLEAAGILSRMRETYDTHPEVSVRHNRTLNPNKR